MYSGNLKGPEEVRLSREYTKTYSKFLSGDSARELNDEET